MGFLKKFKTKLLYKLIFATLLVQIVYQAIIYVTFWAMFADELAGTPQLTMDIAIQMAVGIVLLATWVFLLSVLGRRFMKPLEEVVSSVRAACEGEIGRKAVVRSEDE